MADFNPFYSQGTIAVSSGGTVATGVGTAFNTAGIRVGDLLINATFTSWAMVTAEPTSATSLAITTWPGTTLGAGSAYRIWRISDADRVIAANAAFMQNLTPNLSALGALAGVADRIIYFTGPGAVALAGLSPYMRNMLSSTVASGALANLGAGATGAAVLAASTTRVFLQNAGILLILGNLADDAVLSFTFGSGTRQTADIFSLTFNTPLRAGLYAVRTAPTANSIVSVGVLPALVNLQTATTPPTGTTGPDGNINIFAVNDGRVYIENRIGSVLSGINVMIFPTL